MENKPLLPYVIGMQYNEELAPDHVRFHVETANTPESGLLHSHMFYELAYVRQCAGAEYRIGEDTYWIHSGDILLIPPKVVHGPILSKKIVEICVRDTLWIGQQFLNRLSRLNPNVWLYKNGDIHLFRPENARGAELGKLFRRGVMEQEEKAFGWEGIVLGNTTLLVSLLARALLEQSLLVRKEEPSELLIRVLDYLEANLEEKLTLELLANRFDVSKSTLTQLFRKRMDISFYAYLTKRRLTVARDLISRGIPLEQVGKQVGYKEHSAFYRAFKQEYDMSPQDYRNCCAENGTLVTPHKNKKW